MRKQVQYQHLLHGGDYNPEQWLDRPDILEKDMKYFKKAHINTVSIGMFSWSMLEPEEGRYEFGWLEDTIERLYKNGISVVLSTPSGARPKWLSDRYPEVLRVTPDRHRNLFGGRQNHCYTSPVYREKVTQIDQELARRFGSHPAVILWHISNEFGGECHCPLCQQAFREWLREKYGTIDNLNKQWCTTFWSHRYNSFEEIESPSPRGEMALHALTLDWKRFVTKQTLEFIEVEKAALLAGGSDKPTTVNLMYDFAELDYGKFKDAVDIISWDNYPTWHKEEEWETALDCGLQHDLMRSIQKKPFLLIESCPSATNWQSVSKLKKPGMLRAASLHALAHGSDSVMYFQMRQSRGASEKFHGAVIDHYGGSDTRVFREVTEIGEALEKLTEITGSEIHARAAVLYDRENDWAMKDSQGPRNQDLHYMECVKKQYKALRCQGLDVDILSMDHELTDYQILAVPMAYMFREGYEKKLADFVEAGGTLVMTYWSGIVDQTDRCHLGGTPHGLMDVMGLRSTEMDALYDWEENHAQPVKNNHLKLSKTYTCKNFCDLVETKGAEPLMVYTEDFYQGMPVLTHHTYGKGHAYYVAADLEERFYQDLYAGIVQEAEIPLKIRELPEGVEVTCRENEETEYLFIQNFARKPVCVKIPEGYECIYGSMEETMNPLETKVLKKSK